MCGGRQTGKRATKKKDGHYSREEGGSAGHRRGACALLCPARVLGDARWEGPQCADDDRKAKKGKGTAAETEERAGRVFAAAASSTGGAHRRQIANEAKEAGLPPMLLRLTASTMETNDERLHREAPTTEREERSDDEEGGKRERSERWAALAAAVLLKSAPG